MEEEKFTIAQANAVPINENGKFLEELSCLVENHLNFILIKTRRILIICGCFAETT